MSTGNEHLRYEEELAAYLLDALPGDEARAFERHLETCARCQEQARWLQGSVEMLPAAVEQVEPPPALRERLMRTVYADADAAAEAAPGPSRARRSWRRLFAVPRPALALGAVLLAAVAIGAYALGSGDDGQQTVTAEAQAPPGVTAVVERTGDKGILRVTGLPQRTHGIYEVWLARGKEVPVPSALFQTHRNGSGAAAIPKGLDDADQVMVTFEPPHGSARPTRDPIIVAKI